jgi:hypothetical protein
MHGGDLVHKHASDVCSGDSAFDATWLSVAFNPLERQGDWRAHENRLDERSSYFLGV